MGDGGEYFVAGSMAPIVVDCLEIVQIETDNREDVAAALVWDIA